LLPVIEIFEPVPVSPTVIPVKAALVAIGNAQFSTMLFVTLPLLFVPDAL
jgi:hypothetical protein